MDRRIPTLCGNRIPVIVGPTGVGKTAFAIELAQEISGEIVSVDSRQIYQGFRIGTAQPTPAERRRVPHHLVDILPADRVISAGNYVDLVREKTVQIQKGGKRPILTGGTLLYVQAICHGIVEDSGGSKKLRREIEERLKAEGAETLYRELEQIDPDYAGLIHANDLKRIARAHEIYRQSGKAPSQVFREQQQKDRAIRSGYFLIGLKRDRSVLYQRIEQRVDTMLESGWPEEVRRLLEEGVDRGQHAMQSVGYRQLIEVHQGKLELEKAAEIIKQKTRQFAKRQLTWLRKMDLDFEVELS
ncbi:MAG: tRNA (adenosine(37)-N6)-dimethylallyltransferase MiaA [FCB group bacterium]|nr:tRNA (adenosine(37)-N6)-dimethylallyltransferase MiaA [FCB group bacterium]